jgi:hypothetical protein
VNVFERLFARLLPSPATKAGRRVVAQMEAQQRFSDALKAACRGAGPLLVREATVHLQVGTVHEWVSLLLGAARSHFTEASSKVAAERTDVLGRWVARRLVNFASALGDEVVRQHALNVVLQLTGQGYEAAIVDAGMLDSPRLGEALGDLLCRCTATAFTGTELKMTQSTLLYRGKRPSGEFIQAP